MYTRNYEFDCPCRNDLTSLCSRRTSVIHLLFYFQFGGDDESCLFIHCGACLAQQPGPALILHNVTYCCVAGAQPLCFSSLDLIFKLLRAIKCLVYQFSGIPSSHFWLSFLKNANQPHVPHVTPRQREGTCAPQSPSMKTSPSFPNR